jgi:hypothetical protein
MHKIFQGKLHALIPISDANSEDSIGTITHYHVPSMANVYNQNSADCIVMRQNQQPLTLLADADAVETDRRTLQRKLIIPLRQQRGWLGN